MKTAQLIETMVSKAMSVDDVLLVLISGKRHRRQAKDFKREFSKTRVYRPNIGPGFSE